MRNALLVFMNQREILKASKSTDFIFLRPVPAPSCGGHVEHYYHFIFDLILPLNILLKITPSNVVFMLEKIGVFTDRLQYLFPGRIRIENESTFPRETKRMNLVGMNPRGIHLTRKALESFRIDICSILGIKQVDNNNKVLLIERMPPDHYFIEEAKRKGGGSLRRSILNHYDLKSILHSMVRGPFEFHNLQLEKISFKEQVAYFSSAKVVIAQHGAGLANCVWMNPGSFVVELNNEMNLKHFSILSKLKRHSYYFYKLPGLHSELDIDDFSNWISGATRLSKFFVSCENQRA